MKPQFTTNCYIKIEDAQQRNKVCEKLYSMGYKHLWDSNEQFKSIIFADAEDRVVRLLRNADGLGIECNSISLFLDLAAMRSDTLIGQIVIYGGGLHRITGVENGVYNIDYFHFRKEYEITCATATEIIEWHFETRNLIDKGEAIDVNTLPNNPYSV